MRVFFAIFPPLDTYGRFFADVFRHFDKQKRNLNFIPLEQIHLNMRFIGANVSEASYKYIIDLFKVYEGQYTKPEVKVKNIQFGFKHQTNPNYVIADIFESESLVSLSNEIHKLIKHLDLKDTIRWKEKHTNTYHISLARKKKDKGSTINKELREISRSMNLHYPEAFVSQELAVMQSIITRQGPIYKKIDSVKL